MLVEVSCAVAETDATFVLPPVTTVTPGGTFSRMTKGGPAIQFVEQLFGQSVEDLFGTTASKVVGPAFDDRVEFASQACLTLCVPRYWRMICFRWARWRDWDFLLLIRVLKPACPRYERVLRIAYLPDVVGC